MRRTAAGQLLALALAMVLGMAPWFSATAVAPVMIAELHLPPETTPWFTMSVQVGFVLGTLVSAALMLSDRWRTHQFAGWCALAAGVSTALVATSSRHADVTFALRAVTGAALAGVYPPGMKLVAGWWRDRRGLAIGVLVGALTIGSAVPHLVQVLVPPTHWRLVVFIAAASAAAASLLLFVAVRPGPYQAPSAPFAMNALGRVVRDRGVVLATLGYLGHMWELYAMWSWIASFWLVVVTARALPRAVAPIMAFAGVATGAIGCVIGGWLADRYGRTLVTMVAMMMSGVCAIAIGPSASGPLTLIALLTVLWGMSVVADSAQFSACITELAPREYVGTALTLQTALGFLLTTVSIRGVAAWATRWGWSYAFMPLALGPAIGTLAMFALRRSPDASRLAGGAR